MLNNNLSFYSKLIIIVIIGFSSCYYPKYLSTGSKANINPYGSYLNINLKDKTRFDGELITIDILSIKILTSDKIKKPSQIITIPLSSVKVIKLRYAQPPSFIGLFILTVAPFTLFKGVGGIFAGINALICTIITSASSNLYSFKVHEDFYTKISMYSRYPYGFPESISIDSLKYPKVVLPLKMKYMVDPGFSYLFKTKSNSKK